MEIENSSERDQEIKELITWLEVKKVNDFSNGAIFCQLLDIIYEGKADISKLDWTTQENSNFSILEQILSRFKINRKFDVSSNFDKKKQAKILEKDEKEIFRQLKWIRMFSSSSRNLGAGYNPKEKRGNLELDFTEENPKIKEIKISLLEPETTLKEKSDENMIMKPKIAFKIDPKTVQKLAQWDQMKSERDFYYSKLKDIDHILDVYKDASVDTLIQTIKEVLYLPPEKIAMVTDSGQVVIKGMEEDDDFNQKENINANFLGDDDGELNFDFDGGAMNLLNDKLEL